MPQPPNGSHAGPFWSVFESSQIPMALVDSERRYVAANDAATKLYRSPREDIIGQRLGRGIQDEDPAIADEQWKELVRTGEYYGEHVVRVASGPPLRVSFAAHATTVDGQWAALFVVLSAQVEPEGEELISSASPNDGHGADSDASGAGGSGFISRTKGLTPREVEIVERVALGRSTPQIAAGLNLSPATVRSHVRNAMVKTGAHTRAQLVALMLGEGLARG
jgi:DNA-binding CsgD family transcriptional regulator